MGSLVDAAGKMRGEGYKGAWVRVRVDFYMRGMGKLCGSLSSGVVVRRWRWGWRWGRRMMMEGIVEGGLLLALRVVVVMMVIGGWRTQRLLR